MAAIPALYSERLRWGVTTHITETARGDGL